MLGKLFILYLISIYMLYFNPLWAAIFLILTARAIEILFLLNI